MKAKLTLALATMALLSTLNPQLSTVFAQGTAFTYQGRLNDGSGPANGSYDLKFTLFNALSGPSQVGAIFTNTATAVSNGLFTVVLDFGANFPGADRWLEIGVRTNGGASFATLSPRQKLTPTAYAITAENVAPGAGLSGTYGSAITLNNSANQFIGTFIGNGAGLTNVNTATLGGLASSNFWQLGGNIVAPGQFLGSTNNQPVEIWVNGFRALRLEPNTNGAPNVVGGSAINFVAPGTIGATIGGGGTTNDGFGSVFSNSVSGDFATVGGGEDNVSGGNFDTVGGGLVNTASNQYSTVSGGVQNTSGQEGDTVGGGEGNTCIGGSATVGGGYGNVITAGFATISGGAGNNCNRESGTVGGGDGNTISSEEATIGGGHVNTITNAYGATIGGGFVNTVRYGICATIAGGVQNYAGYDVTLTGDYSSVGGGYGNTAQGDYSTTPGGYFNWAPGKFSFAAGNRAKANFNGDFVWADSQNADFNSSASDQFAIRAQGGVLLDNSTPAINFGTQTRQMLNLFQGGYGIGVQNFTTYFRSGGDFCWFKGGVHSDTQDDPGSGGSRVMLLNAGGLTVNGTFVSASDRNLKAGFAPVDAKAVLEKVAALPITSWHYLNDTNTPHLGPVAQDFYAAFSVGPDDKHITTVDESGVALAAIQGLNEKVEVRTQRSDDRIQKLEAENAELKQRLDALEKIIHNQKSN